MQLSLEIVRVLVESPEEFPIDFEDAWRWLEYSTKANARRTLVQNFERGLDFSSTMMKIPQGGRPKEIIMLTTDCFKSLGMMAGTPRGKEIRKYFLECERQLKELMRSQQVQPTTPPPRSTPAALPPNSFMSAELSPDNELYQLFREAGKREIIRKFLVS